MRPKASSDQEQLAGPGRRTSTDDGRPDAEPAAQRRETNAPSRMPTLPRPNARPISAGSRPELPVDEDREDREGDATCRGSRWPSSRRSSAGSGCRARSAGLRRFPAARLVCEPSSPTLSFGLGFVLADQRDQAAGGDEARRIDENGERGGHHADAGRRPNPGPTIWAAEPGSEAWRCPRRGRRDRAAPAGTTGRRRRRRRSATRP